VGDVAVVGAGIVGLAVARLLAERGDDVVVLEKEDRVAAHQTGHNSGVVHAGIYYAPGSLKAQLCARGRVMIRDYCLERGLPYAERGKLVVAADETELGALTALETRARANGVPGLGRLDGAGLRRVEPHVAGVAGLHSPHTAVVDYVAIAREMADDVRRAGGEVRLGHRVVGIERRGGRVQIRIRAGEDEERLLADRLVACAGLQSDAVAALVGAEASPRILPFRGEYWELSADAAAKVRGLVYPVPDPRFPFLGVHFTRGVDGVVRVGPNAVPALAREGYRWRDVSVRDTAASLGWPGALPLAREHWRMGVHETWGSLSRRAYLSRARRYLPSLRAGELRRSGAGVRAQAWGRDGSLLDDFAIDARGTVTILRNAPSPAATSSMAIAEHLLGRI